MSLYIIQHLFSWNNLLSELWGLSRHVRSLLWDQWTRQIIIPTSNHIHLFIYMDCFPIDHFSKMNILQNLSYISKSVHGKGLESLHTLRFFCVSFEHHDSLRENPPWPLITKYCHNPNSTSTQLKSWVWHENDFNPPPPTHHPPTQTQCQQYLSCYWPDFNQSLKLGSWDEQQQQQ